MTVAIRVPLKFNLVAEIVSDESDRSIYIPPPVHNADHHETCGCPVCVHARQVPVRRA